MWGMSTRLPVLQPARDRGFIYVTRCEGAYKIGFSRASVPRRVRDSKGELVLIITTGQRPAVLERMIHKRFAGKLLPPRGAKPGDKREWFALDETDLAWLRGFAAHLDPQDIV